MLRDLADTILNTAYENHSVMAEAENGVVLTTRIWWVQCEAIIGFVNAYQKTGDARYFNAAEEIWQYIETYFIDPRPNSEWYSEVDKNGVPDRHLPMEMPLS